MFYRASVINIKSTKQYEDDCPPAIVILSPIAKTKLLRLSITAYVVFQEYLEEAARYTADYEDSHIASKLNWPIERVRKAREKLTAAGWFELYTCPCTEKVLDVTPVVTICNLGLLDESPDKPHILKYRVTSTKYDHDCTEEELKERYPHYQSPT